MNNFSDTFNKYLDYCTDQKRLDGKTLKAYKIDLKQFSEQMPTDISSITPEMLETYVANLHKKYKPKTVKRKIASIKAFFHFMEYRDIIAFNPFNKVHIKFREPIILPKTIPLNIVEAFISTIYKQRLNGKTTFQKRNALRDAAVIELLFATGIRISELCSLKTNDVNFFDRTILIYGKGSKERKVQIGNDSVVEILEEYKKDFQSETKKSGLFFVNQDGTPISDQAIRRMIKKYASLASIELHITPHMFRHTFATSLLEADVDIRYIQEILGHSSINITEIYTHVAMAKQRDILTTKHPRNKFNV